MTAPATPGPADGHVLDPAFNPFVLPERLTAGHRNHGPLFDDDVWDFRDFVPRSYGYLKVDFTRLPEGLTRRAAKEYLYSRINRVRQLAYRSRGSGKSMKITGVMKDFYIYCQLVEELAKLGVTRLADARQEHLDRIRQVWKAEIKENTMAVRINTIQHIEAHAAFMPSDRLTFVPWKGRPATQVAKRLHTDENLTPRIPEQIMGPFLRAAVFYVETASKDILAAQREVRALQRADAERGRLPRGEGARRTRALIERRRAEGRGIPALPADCLPNRPGSRVVDGVVQAPNLRLFNLIADVGQSRYNERLIFEAGQELGWEEGGLDTQMSIWPDSGRPWRPRLELRALHAEEQHLRTACWILIAYLSGMRDGELMELRRDCARTGVNAAGRTTYKLHGKVFKGRRLTGEEADWVVLDIVHQAVQVLLQLNDDETHLFAYRLRPTSKPLLATHVQDRLNDFRDHANRLFTTGAELFVPLDGEQPWSFNSLQFRRTLAWHIAHQPFGVVAGTRQYKHAKTTIFEGYAGSSASGFAAEVAAEEAVAMLDYVEDLYRDWNDGTRSGGGAAARINNEFDRIRAELGDLPGVISDATRLRTMIKHLAKTLHPGVLNDCFFNAATAVCVKRAKTTGRPLPRHNMCLSCPNARRSTIHLPRLKAARAQAEQLQADCAQAAKKGSVPPLQQAAITTYIGELDQVIAEIGTVRGGTEEDA